MAGSEEIPGHAMKSFCELIPWSLHGKGAHSSLLPEPSSCCVPFLRYRFTICGSRSSSS
ncbi:hypothetical protein HPP92_028621 [Vanilla planifolia]|uniref:Uncharacterized protein n=1 Tax=Vanilla planifolia TaxID=51239 RepID=A0A835P562_VANPL|nr:hypothetical protein HPP92_028621 [Vanilla planifolia]